MRTYFFGNFYFSSIQQGIQALHALAEMMTKYRFDEKANTLYDWIDNHKTTILLNGGDQSALEDLMYFFNNDDNPYPWGHFKEAPEATNSTLTSVGIVLPAKIYDGAQYLRMARLDDKISLTSNDKGKYQLMVKENDEVVFNETYSEYEKNLMEMLPQYSLAR